MMSDVIVLVLLSVVCSNDGLFVEQTAVASW